MTGFPSRMYANFHFPCKENATFQNKDRKIVWSLNPYEVNLLPQKLYDDILEPSTTEKFKPERELKVSIKLSNDIDDFF